MQSNRSLRVFLVTSIPPPPGGVAVHSERLCRLLTTQGYKVDAFEMHTRWASPEKIPFAYHYGLGIWTLFRFILSCFTGHPDLIHIHLSAARRVFPLFPVIVFLSRFFKIILTVHSGSFTKRVSEASPREANWLGRGFRAACAVIAVSPANRDILLNCFGVCESRIHVIPAFLNLAAPTNVTQVASSCEKRVFLASGYATPIYYWEGLLDAIQGLPILDELVLAFYSQYDQPYFDEVLEKARQSGPFRVTIHRDLSAEDFHRELSRASMFIRPTLTDGDSIALREALAMKKRVVASDAVARPAGCMMFRSRDVKDLRQKVIEASEMPAQNMTLKDGDFSKPLLELYQRLLSEPVR